MAVLGSTGSGYAIYSAGGFGREVLPLVQEQIKLEAQSGDAIFVDDGAESRSSCNGVRVIGFDDLVQPPHNGRRVIVAVSDGRLRQSLAQKCIQSGISFGEVKASTSRILYGAEFGNGSILCDYTVLTANIKVGHYFQCNLYSYVGHDCTIGDYVTFAPRVSCNGNIIIEDFAYVGTGAFLRQGTRANPLVVGRGAVVGMGAVVTKDVAPFTVVAGNPARVIRQLTPE